MKCNATPVFAVALNGKMLLLHTTAYKRVCSTKLLCDPHRLQYRLYRPLRQPWSYHLAEWVVHSPSAEHLQSPAQREQNKSHSERHTMTLNKQLRDKLTESMMWRAETKPRLLLHFIPSYLMLLPQEPFSCFSGGKCFGFCKAPQVNWKNQLLSQSNKLLFN